MKIKIYIMVQVYKFFLRYKIKALFFRSIKENKSYLVAQSDLSELSIYPWIIIYLQLNFYLICCNSNLLYYIFKNFAYLIKMDYLKRSQMNKRKRN